MTDRDRHRVAVLDTSVVIDLDALDESQLPLQSAIAAVTLAELSAGLHTTNDPIERAVRLARLQVIEASFDPLPFDASAARHYGHLVARSHRSRAESSTAANRSDDRRNGIRT